MDKYKIIAIIAIIMLLLIIIVLNSRTRIYKTFNKYMKIDNKLNITGKQFAFIAKEHLGLTDLKFALTPRKLGDAYSYKYKTLILSEDVCNTASIASLTIVAHELGHAMQHRDDSSLFNITIRMKRITRWTNHLFLPLLITGLIFNFLHYPNESTGIILMIISGCFFLLHILTKLLTIPLEYNASRRGLKFLKENKCLSLSEHYRAKKLLSIAAQTYIADFLDDFIPIRRKKRKKPRRRK